MALFFTLENLFFAIVGKITSGIITLKANKYVSKPAMIVDV